MQINQLVAMSRYGGTCPLNHGGWYFGLDATVHSIYSAASFSRSLLRGVPVDDGRETGRDRKALGRLFRDARRAKKLSQAALGRAANVSPVFVSQIETGQRIPSDRVARKLATALGLPWQEVLRAVYMLRSDDAGDLFASFEDQITHTWKSIYDIPSVRFLLLQLAGLGLPPSDVETLVRNWSNDITLLVTLAEARR